MHLYRVISEISLIFCLIFILYGCKSTSYEIIEEPAEFSENQDNLISHSPPELKDFYGNEFQSYVRENESSLRNAGEDKTFQNQHYSNYIIQLGAFVQKDNALKFLNMARVNFTDASIRLIEEGDLLKVIYGMYNNIKDAEANLTLAKQRGYHDAFIRKAE